MANFEQYHNLPKGSVSVDQVIKSASGIDGWAYPGKVNKNQIYKKDDDATSDFISEYQRKKKKKHLMKPLATQYNGG
jgi:hypothetical protein